ncbi:uncharacterized protein [Rutidosis leptorrhynchoides]|uniref:uncharacterized protein n=1 Tax=Rutidosis leptorrhynchoides TaxID=125765 RepID=UPI003A999EB4
MYEDFTDINKACPKDNYPLPEIDWKVESVSGYQFKSFLDAFKGYHQIPMAIRDQDKLAFHTPYGIFCYIMMPFGLKNTGATYQRVIDKAFKDQIGKNVEAYVDDIVIKSHTEDSMLRDTLETFDSLRKVNMKLNPKKCTFGVEEEEAEAAFQDIKRLLKELPTLTAPIAGETLILYLAVSTEAISSVLIAERKGIQMPIYFALFSGKFNSRLDISVNKTDFAESGVVGTSGKMDYFQNDKNNNFVWELHTDSASSEDGVGAGLVLTSPEGEEHTYALKFCFYASNNEAEYKELLSSLRIATNMGIKHLRAYVDSQIVAQQVNGGFKAKDVSMKQYLQLVEKISKNFETLEVVQIPRNKNKKADVLSKLATLTFYHLHKKVLVEVLKKKSIDEKVVIATVEEGESCWITPYVKYLQDGTLPTDVVEARRIRVSAPLYVLENGCFIENPSVVQI